MSSVKNANTKPPMALPPFDYALIIRLGDTINSKTYEMPIRSTSPLHAMNRLMNIVRMDDGFMFCSAYCVEVERGHMQWEFTVC